MNTAEKLNSLTLKIEQEERQLYPNRKLIDKWKGQELRLTEKIENSPKLQAQWEEVNGIEFDW